VAPWRPSSRASCLPPCEIWRYALAMLVPWGASLLLLHLRGTQDPLLRLRLMLKTQFLWPRATARWGALDQVLRSLSLPGPMRAPLT
jgi:hypothetical protein